MDGGQDPARRGRARGLSGGGPHAAVTGPGTSPRPPPGGLSERRGFRLCRKRRHLGSCARNSSPGAPLSSVPNLRITPRSRPCGHALDGIEAATHWSRIEPLLPQAAKEKGRPGYPALTLMLAAASGNRPRSPGTSPKTRASWQVRLIAPPSRSLRVEPWRHPAQPGASAHSKTTANARAQSELPKTAPFAEASRGYFRQAEEARES
ncbi:hypothetical protein SAMN05421751_10855 [Jhaorihella thermophila]|uniref:Uncharacterized protein n=1 Tax=Jhaorihella thermophila TaxID=488547 RepID=A0A1H5WJ89_9RHOB|nr:hypothetical protein SAMN05421751_10855 [Jhaorihella thermophila]